MTKIVSCARLFISELWVFFPSAEVGDCFLLNSCEHKLARVCPVSAILYSNHYQICKILQHYLYKAS